MKTLKWWTGIGFAALLTWGVLPQSAEGFTKDFLVWDPDVNHNSGPDIRSLLTGLGYSGDYNGTTTLPGNLSDYRSIWITLGVAFDNWTLTSPQGQSLVNYLTGRDSTNIYMEGGDTWMIDPSTPIHPYFHITGVRNGWGDTDEVLGQTGTFTAGMIFNYTVDNAFMDQISSDALSFEIFADTHANVGDFDYYNGVAYDRGSCSHTVGASFEFDGLVDGTSPSTKANLAEAIMNFFCISRPSYSWDVAPLSILEPDWYALPNLPLYPRVTVRNLGSNTSSFNLYCRIGAWNYLPEFVSNLLPDSSREVIIAGNPWVPPNNPGSPYSICVWTILAPDENPANDTLCKDGILWDGRWMIPSNYTDTVPIADGNIDPTEWADAEVRDVSDILGKAGGPEPPGAAYLYTMNDSLNLYLALDAIADPSFTAPGDLFYLEFEDNHDHAYPCLPDSSEGELTVIVNSPPQNALFEFEPRMCDTIVPARPAGVAGWMETTSGHMQYEVRIPLSQITPNYTLNASPCDTVGFWLGASDYGARIGYAWWPTSSNVGFGNLLDMGDIIIACVPPVDTLHDAGALSITWPPDTICMRTGYTPRAWVRNYGNVREDVQVRCFIDGPVVDYSDAETLSIASGDSSFVSFDIWNVPPRPPDSIFYSMRVWTEVPGDTLPGNDSTQPYTIFAFECLIGIEEENSSSLPRAYNLSQARPNPTTSTARILYNLPMQSHVTLGIYDIIGRVMKVLVDGVEEAGYRSVVWDGRDRGGMEVASGVYFVKLTASSNSSFNATRKVVLLR